MIPKRIGLLLAIMIFITPPPAAAQYDIPQSVISSGGVICTGSHIVYCTVGQTAIGVSTGSHQVQSGFWYPAGISSTVDVAITSFIGEYTGEVVFLRWSVTADVPFLGFNVYRSEEGIEDFTKLNEQLIPPQSMGEYTDTDVLPAETYAYILGAVSAEGEFRSPEISIKIPPKPFTLYQNAPNPFNPSTTIKYYLPEDALVALDIYDISGKRIARLVNEGQEKGYYTVVWNGKDTRGNVAASGLYFYRLIAGKKKMSKKMVLLR